MSLGISSATQGHISHPPRGARPDTKTTVADAWSAVQRRRRIMLRVESAALCGTSARRRSQPRTLRRAVAGDRQVVAASAWSEADAILIPNLVRPPVSGHFRRRFDHLAGLSGRNPRRSSRCAQDRIRLGLGVTRTAPAANLFSRRNGKGTRNAPYTHTDLPKGGDSPPFIKQFLRKSCRLRDWPWLGGWGGRR